MQVLVNGLITGLGLAVLAVGFCLAFMPTRVFAIGQAGVYSLACYVSWACLVRDIAAPLAVAAGVLTGALVSGASEAFHHGLLARKRASDASQLVASLGFLIVVIQGIALAWGPDTQSWRIGADPTVVLAGIRVTRAQWVMAGGAMSLLVVFFVCLRASRAGLMLRAVAANPEQYGVDGHNPWLARSGAFLASGAVISIAALLFANDIGFDPYAGLELIFLAVVGAVVGGRTSFAGAAVGGVLLGVLRSVFVWLASSRWVDPMTFGVLCVFLFVRPEGLLGRHARAEAQA